jgi:regulation of enolase protein 1 (concanavalin A-like superfamily)
MLHLRFRSMPSVVFHAAALLWTGMAVAGPLTVYDQPSLEGTSATIPDTHTIYIDGSIPGRMNDKISSFRLEQGHMAVLSTDSDGMGLGKCFIASDAPLTIEALPEHLDNAVSWIRVVPWRQTLKKGLGSTASRTPGVVNTSWYYHWGVNVQHGQQENHKWGEYVPMPRKVPEVEKAGQGMIDDILSMNQITHVMVFNEVGAQSEDDFTKVIKVFSTFQETGLRIGGPSGTGSAASREDRFTPKFLQACDARGIRVDLTCLHWYDNYRTRDDDPERIFTRFKEYISRAYHYCGRRPLAITEFNAGKRTVELQDGFLERALPYLEACGYVERYAWFQPRDGRGAFFDEEGKITSTGLIYKNQVSTPAYVPNRMPASMANCDISDSEQSGQVIHANGTFTVSGKGVGFDGTADECQFVYTPITGDCAITARLFDMIALEESNSRAGIMIRDSLDANSSLAAMLMTSDGARFQYRTKVGAPSGHVSDTKICAPIWLRVVRGGDKLSGYTSADGNTWSLVSSQIVTMDSQVFLGMAVSQQDPKNGYFSDAIFSDLSIDPITLDPRDR